MINSFLEENMNYIDPENYMLFYEEGIQVDKFSAIDIVDQLIKSSEPGIKKKKKKQKWGL